MISMYTGLYLRAAVVALVLGASLLATAGLTAQVQGGRASVVPPASRQSPVRQQSPTFESSVDLTYDAFQITRESRDTLNEADLVAELATLTRAAQRANAKFYPIDPRGLIAGQSIDDEVNPQDFQDHVRDTQTSLRVIAEETGGVAVINQNDFDKGLRRIDAETSDYYLLGFVSSNPDRLRRTRKIEVRVRAPAGLTVGFPPEYSLRPLSRPGK